MNQRSDKNIFYSISFDDIYQIKEDFDNKKWKEAQNQMFDLTENIIKSVLNGVFPKDLEILNQENLILIIDDNFYYKSMRNDYLRLCKEYNISFAQIFLTSSLEKSLERNENRFNKVPNQIIKEMREKFEIPKHSNEDGEYILHIDTTKDIIFQDIFPSILELISISLLNPLFDQNKEKKEVSEKDRKETMESILHQSDIKLRKIVSEKILTFQGKNKSEFAKKVNDERKRILLGITKNIENSEEFIENFKNFYK